MGLPRQALSAHRHRLQIEALWTNSGLASLQLQQLRLDNIRSRTQSSSPAGGGRASVAPVGRSLVLNGSLVLTGGVLPVNGVVAGHAVVIQASSLSLKLSVPPTYRPSVGANTVAATAAAGTATAENQKTNVESINGSSGEAVLLIGGTAASLALKRQNARRMATTNRYDGDDTNGA